MKNVTDFFTSRNLYYAFLHVAVVALAIQVVVLSGQNRRLKEGGTRSNAEELKTGDTLFLYRLQAVQAGGQLDTLSRRQMIFIMSTTCPFCAETVPVWKELAVKVTPLLSVFGISLDSRDSTLEYIKRNAISFAVFVPLDAAIFKKMNKTRGVPQTIIRDANGKVEKIWNGKLDREKLNEVVAALQGSKINQTTTKEPLL